MKAAVIVFPGSNCDRDVAVALEQATGTKPVMVWHRDSEVPPVDLIVLPGGFSHGDYLRSGAMAARAPIMASIKERASAGVLVLGICNGFQILTEAGLLPGALMRNAGLKFICRSVRLKVENTASAFTRAYRAGEEVNIPIAHADGNFFADDDTLKRIEDQGQVAFRYLDNPNGSAHDIAGVFNQARTVLGLMPHPERVCEPAHGGTDGRRMFEGIVSALGSR
ncbi:MAG: phosphoribosylformylglycinamidine synthase subunit PurQ [Rhodospirillaceae bacterium]